MGPLCNLIGEPDGIKLYEGVESEHSMTYFKVGLFWCALTLRIEAFMRYVSFLFVPLMTSEYLI